MPTALTIGNFDGVHAGHAALVDRCRHHAGPEGKVVVLAFDPHPRATLVPGSEPARLTTFARRASLLEQAGADEVHPLEPTPDLLSMSPRAFLERITSQHRPSHVVEGGDFRFGRARAGGIEELRAIGTELGFTTDIVQPVMVTLRDQSVVRASSSIVRWLLAGGRVRDAAYALGRPHRLTGEVARGDQRGRTIGFPTANLATEIAPPADGVYACLATLPDGSTTPAAVNVGTRPTVQGTDRRVEAHLLFDDAPRAWSPLDGQPEYGWPLALDLVGWVRDQARFPSLDALRAQLDRDCARVRTIMSSVLTSQEPAA